MPGIRHEAAVELLHQDPQLAAGLLAAAGVQVPDGPVQETDSNLSARRPLAFSAENVILFGRPRAKGKGGARGKRGGRLAVIVEVQTRPPSREKRRDWVAYHAIAGREHDCDAVVLVIALQPDTARRSRIPFRTGPGNEFRVVVAGPRELLDQAPGFGPEMVVLATMGGALDLDQSEDRKTVLEAVAPADPSDRRRYLTLILSVASEQARVELEKLMSTTYKETFVDRLLAEGEAKGRVEGKAEGRAEGKAEGEAKLLLRTLTARGLEVPARMRKMITACTDTGQIEAWFDRALNASSLDEVFGTRDNPA